MLRRMATFVLLVPLSLNGLWMLCAEESPTVGAETAPPSAEASEHCKKMCPIPHAETETAPLEVPQSGEGQTGAICLLSSNGDGASIDAIAFAVTMPAAVVTVASDLTVREFTTERAIFYGDPLLSGLTPPPRA